jgi:DNA-binding NtrC family response regulator
VIDDEELIRKTLKSTLERYGFQVILAENGGEGVDLFRAIGHKVSVVILDMTMPVISGEETFRRLKSIRPNVRVVLSSGYNEVETVQRFTGKDLAGFLQKPYTAETLIARVRETMLSQPAERPLSS